MRHPRLDRAMKLTSSLGVFFSRPKRRCETAEASDSDAEEDVSSGGEGERSGDNEEPADEDSNNTDDDISGGADSSNTICENCPNQRAHKKYGGLVTRCCVRCSKHRDPEWYTARIAETRCPHCPNQRADRKYEGQVIRCCVSCAVSKHPGWHAARIAESRRETCSNQRSKHKYGGLTTRFCGSCAGQSHPEWHAARIAETRCEQCHRNQRDQAKYGGLVTQFCISCAEQRHPEWHAGWRAAHACKSPHCDTFRSKSLEGYCAPCFRHKFPLDKRAKWSLSKEVAVAKFLSERFPELDRTFNKVIPGGRSRRRPDAFVRLCDRAVSVEIDEFSHVGYECLCESRKVMEHFDDAGRLPHLFLRFNPDGYTNPSGGKVPSCWGKTPKTQEPRVSPKQAGQWVERLEKLGQVVELFMGNLPEKEVSVVELFYR